MSETTIKAPKLSHWIFVLKDGKFVFDKKTLEAIDKVYAILEAVEPCGEDNRRELWLKAERGTIDDYDDYERLKDEEVVENYEEFEKMWHDEYPDEISWYHLVTIERNDYRAMFLGRELIYQSRILEDHSSYEYNVEELFVWMQDAVKKCIAQMQEETYNDEVNNNLNARQRTGTISRKDYWDIFPERKDSYLSDITDAEVKKFVSYISEQHGNKPVGSYLDEMTAERFYEFCSMGYKANKYEHLEGLTAKEQYYKMADGRDNGLSEIDGESPSEFADWLNDLQRKGGHPWEVCRGGNSTHVGLYVHHNENGYYLAVAGKSWSRSIEAIKFYNVLRDSGTAVYLYEAKGITDRLLGQDIIGIVPEHVIPVYCEQWFPGMKILDFMNLPYEDEPYEMMLEKIVWLPEEKQYLKNNKKMLVPT